MSDAARKKDSMTQEDLSRTQELKKIGQASCNNAETWVTQIASTCESQYQSSHEILS
jgi:hypothetical protein